MPISFVTAKNKVLDDYIAFRSLRNHTKRGVSDIRFQINRFIFHSKKPLDDFDEQMLTAYVSEITQKYKINMANTVKSSYLKNFIKWYFVDFSSRFRNLKAICQTEKAGKTYKPEDMVTEKDFQRLIVDEESSFWKAFFLTYFYGSCRPVEVCNLEKKVIEYEDDGAFFTIFSEKNKEFFIKFIPKEVVFYLKKIADNGSKYVFANPRTKKPITVKGAYWKLKKMSKKTLGREINLYLLRHSIATINYEKVGDDSNSIEEKDVANQMGHSKSMRSTYEHNNREKLKERAKKIYFNPEELPPKERNEFLEIIKKQNARIDRMEKMMFSIVPR